MNFPLVSEYISSILSSEDNFEVLSSFRPVLNGTGPIMSSGNFAVVFKMKDTVDSKFYAVKCFIKDQPRRKDNYRAIAQELEGIDTPYLSHFKYYEDELFVDSNLTDQDEFDVVVMDWVDGVPLDVYVRANLESKNELKALSDNFNRLASWLISQPFAHGDLKPDNILVKRNGELCLVDYDGMFVPEMAGQFSQELGSPDFRHPLRTNNDFDNRIDDFPLSMIALSLKAISLDPSLYTNYGESERLLFAANDYLNIGQSEAFTALQPLLYDTELQSLLGLFLIALGRNTLDGVFNDIVSSFNSFNPAKVTALACNYPPVLPVIINGEEVYRMILVKGGHFIMGDDSFDREILGNSLSSNPSHPVSLTDYYIGQTLVTRAFWDTVMKSQKKWVYGDSQLMPANNTSYDECLSFIQRLNEQTGLVFSLPTEAQWEFAARGGNKTNNYKFCGSNDADEIGWFGHYPVHNVGLKSPNELGLYDMCGNANEWCEDYVYNYEDSDITQVNPEHNEGNLNYVITRGAICYHGPREDMLFLRSESHRKSICSYTGLRLAIKTRDFYSITDRTSISNNNSSHNPSREIFVNGEVIDMVYVKGGTFVMGEDGFKTVDGNSSSPSHKVTLDDYYISKFLVTNTLWNTIMHDDSKPDDNYPVTGVSYRSICEFINKLSRLSGVSFKLPTEAQWEYAALGGRYSHNYKYSGSNKWEEVAWLGKDCRHEVGLKQPNELGLYDMCGCVCEFCRDLYGPYPDVAVANPLGPNNGTSHVIRGLIAYNNPSGQSGEIKARSKTNDNGWSFGGFRLVIE